LKRKIGIFPPGEGFFALHSGSYDGIKRQNIEEKGHFVANWKKFKRVQ
jgi:hypothetical protein